jgi:hypothetical protein
MAYEHPTDDPVRTFGGAASQEIPVLDEFEDAAAGADSTPLEELRGELASEVADEPEVIPVPARPGYELRFSTDLPSPRLAKLRKASRDRSMPDGIDELGLALRVLATLNIGIIRQGEDLTAAGEPLTIRSPAMLDLLGQGRPTEAMKVLYAKDGHTLAAARTLLKACGYDEDALEGGADPTPGA